MKITVECLDAENVLYNDWDKIPESENRFKSFFTN